VHRVRVTFEIFVSQFLEDLLTLIIAIKRALDTHLQVTWGGVM